MKKLILIALVLITSVSANAQFVGSYGKHYTGYGKYHYPAYKFKDVAVPAVMLAATITTVEVMFHNDTDGRAVTAVAVTGMATTLATHYIIKGVKKNNPHKIYRRRLKRISRR